MSKRKPPRTPDDLPSRPASFLFAFLAAAVCLAALGSFLCGPAGAQQNIAVSCEQISRECPEAVIGEVRIQDHDIFGAEDDLPSWFPWKTVNRLHINTQEGTIRANLLFKTGDVLDVEVIRETQRKLRSLGIFRDERISCTRMESGEVQVDVSVRENWTIIPIVSFQGRGLGTAVTVGLSEQNLLGRGKILSASFRNGAEEGNTIIEQRWSVAYLDPNILRSQYRMYGNYQGLESGEVASAFLEKPFFSLETLWSGQLFGDHSRSTQRLFQGGGIAAQFTQQNDSFGIDLGLAVKRGPPTVHRLRALYTYSTQRISDFVPFLDAPGAFPPPDETYSYPGLGYRRLGVNYILEQRIDRFDREEYFNIANDLNGWFGFSAEALGAEDDQWLFSLTDQQGFRFRTGHFFLLQGSAGGYLRGSDLHNTKFVLNYDHYLRDTCLDFWWLQSTFHWGASVGYGVDLDSDQVFGLGYTTGLRGYDYYGFTGDKMLRFGVEDRIYIKKKLFGIVAFGLLLFGEGGFAWGQEEPMDFADLRYDVGFGLRTAVPSASGGNVVQLTWGFPVGEGYDFFGDTVFSLAVSSTFD
jgi:outer membrane protein assembly factor BamA